MNPSAQGWIKKLLKEVSNQNIFDDLDESLFYDALRSTGFIYGSNLNIVANTLDHSNLSEDEICKINLCLSLLFTHTKSKSDIPFLESVLEFYKEINELETSFFIDLFGKGSKNNQLEKIIHKRIHIDANVFTKNFNYFIINALLYIDVLAYQEYLKESTISSDYVKYLESSIESISLNVLNSKKSKNEYDKSLIELFESSLRYENHQQLPLEKSIEFINTPLKKLYILDLACMASWTDGVLDFKEHEFLIVLSKNLNLEEAVLEKAINSINTFYNTNKENIPLLSSKNIAKSFYNNSSKMVTKLISRNSKRLYQELKDSKELMVLLSHSTVRDLTTEEQKKVHDQLLDVFKSIPSLAIFMLPGGALLLPIVIKFIPKLLPSAFDENRIEDEEK